MMNIQKATLLMKIILIHWKFKCLKYIQISFWNKVHLITYIARVLVIVHISWKYFSSELKLEMIDYHVKKFLPARKKYHFLVKDCFSHFDRYRWKISQIHINMISKCVPRNILHLQTELYYHFVRLILFLHIKVTLSSIERLWIF